MGAGAGETRPVTSFTEKVALAWLDASRYAGSERSHALCSLAAQRRYRAQYERVMDVVLADAEAEAKERDGELVPG